MMEKYQCCLTKEEKQRDRDCENCEGFYNGTDCECAELNRGRSEQFLVEKLKEDIEKLQIELTQSKTARWKIISNRHSSYFQCMNCFATIHGEFSSKFEQRGWIEENPYCRKCGAKMEKE